MDLTAALKKLVRAALGGDPDRETPALDYLGHYRARVAACASDGSTVDVVPDDPRVARSVGQGVPVVPGVPALAAVVQPGAIVWIGWEAGDPARPHALPLWESAVVTKLILAAAGLYLCGESGAERVLTTKDLDDVKAAISGAAVAAQDGGAALKANIIAAWPVAPGSTKVWAQR